jgi:hypothetical protein
MVTTPPWEPSGVLTGTARVAEGAVVPPMQPAVIRAAAKRETI